MYGDMASAAKSRPDAYQCASKHLMCHALSPRACLKCHAIPRSVLDCIMQDFKHMTTAQKHATAYAAQ